MEHIFIKEFCENVRKSIAHNRLDMTQPVPINFRMAKQKDNIREYHSAIKRNGLSQCASMWMNFRNYTKKKFQALYVTWCHLYGIPEKANRSYQRADVWLPGDWVEGCIVYKGAQMNIYYTQISECLH